MDFVLVPERLAVLVLDVQALFTGSEGPFANTSAGPLLEYVNYLTRFCRAAGAPVIFSSYVLSADLHDAGLLATDPVVAAGLFSRGSPWIDIDQRIEKAAGDIELQRNRPSAFWDGGLDQELQRLARDQLLLVGLSANNAVSAAARDAFARDIAAFVVRECTAAAPFEADTDIYLTILNTWTAEVTTLADVKERISG